MKIEDIRIGMKLRNPLAGRVGKVTKIEQEGGLELVGNGLSWHEHVENVVPVSELHIGDYVRATGKSTTFGENVEGKIGIIDSFMNDVSGDKCADIRWLCGSSNLVKVAQLTYVHPVCESCEMARVITSQCKQIAELQRSVEAWTETAARHCRNEAYYHDELEKLQKEALAKCDEKHIHPALRAEDFRPLIDVAKCYIQVAPEKLLLLQNARRIIEFLTAMDAPVAFYRIAEGLSGMVSGTAIIDGLIEAREAGIVRLDDGKYSIVRD